MPYFLADDAADLLYLTNLGCIDHNPWSSRIGDMKNIPMLYLLRSRSHGRHVVRCGPHRGPCGGKAAQRARPALLYENVRRHRLSYVYPARAEIYLRAGAPVCGSHGTARASGIAAPGDARAHREQAQKRHGADRCPCRMHAASPWRAVYSLRPFVQAPVSTPISPRELAAGFQPGDFNIETIQVRLKRRGDLWADFWKERQTLESAVKRAQ